jgi:hypothetical protein
MKMTTMPPDIFTVKKIIYGAFPFIQLITAVLATRCWPARRNFYWRTFIIVWLITFLVEITGKVLGSFAINNHWLYNLFYITFYPGIIILYTAAFKIKWLQQSVIVAAIATLVGGGISLINDIATLNTQFATVGGSAIVLLAITYLAILYNDTDTTTPLKQDPYFWFSIGFVIYFSVITVIIGMYNRIVDAHSAQSQIFTFYINHLMALILHLCLWKGFNAAKKYG